ISLGNWTVFKVRKINQLQNKHKTKQIIDLIKKIMSSCKRKIGRVYYQLTLKSDLLRLCHFQLPFPGCSHYVFQAEFGIPIQHFTRLVIICIYGHNVTWSSRTKFIIELFTTYLFKGMNSFQYSYT